MTASLQAATETLHSSQWRPITATQVPHYSRMHPGITGIKPAATGFRGTLQCGDGVRGGNGVFYLRSPFLQHTSHSY
jgi:hypothetical protein